VVVDGDPVPQGSKNAVAAGRVVEVSAARLKPWRDAIAWRATQARNAAGVWRPASGPVELGVVFRLRCDRGGVPGAAATVTPDVDKLLRAVLDALSGVAYADDRQVADVRAVKRWAAAGERPGVEIAVGFGV